eukprot:TRINITY_DN558_c0_g2_i2.p1 TRINITY_DN558_c0_g2~~TRINITY_DN558_c0_g2_i2.p1  ORF type:complete len:507 (-),score=86.98 TRINITY_DN558_c0_g2_i2:1007-2443(-)
MALLRNAHLPKVTAVLAVVLVLYFVFWYRLSVRCTTDSALSKLEQDMFAKNSKNIQLEMENRKLRAEVLALKKTSPPLPIPLTPNLSPFSSPRPSPPSLSTPSLLPREASSLPPPSPSALVESTRGPSRSSPPHSSEASVQHRVAVVVFAYNRPQELSDCLKLVSEFIPAEFDLVVSQDDDVAGVTSVIETANKEHSLTHIQRLDRDLSAIVDTKSKFYRQYPGYYQLAQHYKFAFSFLFADNDYDFVIVLEDDLQVAPDFFTYMTAGMRLLEQDPTLLTVSAWNDNGRPGLVKDAGRLLRSDFFPGLGWLLSRSLWEELGGDWPAGFWDDWLREPSQRRDRSVIFPEISRTHHMKGKKGTSKGQFTDRYINPMLLNDEPIDWPSVDLTPMTKSNYDAALHKELEQATYIENPAAVENYHDSTLYLEFAPHQQQEYFNHFGLMTDEKAGVYRTEYEGITRFLRATNVVFLVREGSRAA